MRNKQVSTLCTCVQPLHRMRSGFENVERMKTLAELMRLFEALGASERAACERYTQNGQLQLKASDLGHCAVYEKELQRVWPITEENRKAKIAEFGEKHGFRLAYYKQGHCAIFLDAQDRRALSHSARGRDGNQ